MVLEKVKDCFGNLYIPVVSQDRTRWQLNYLKFVDLLKTSNNEWDALPKLLTDFERLWSLVFGEDRSYLIFPEPINHFFANILSLC